MRSQKDPITMKNGVNKIQKEGEQWQKLLQKCQMTFLWKNRPTLYQIISGT